MQFPTGCRELVIYHEFAFSLALLIRRKLATYCLLAQNGRPISDLSMVGYHSPKNGLYVLNLPSFEADTKNGKDGNQAHLWLKIWLWWYIYSISLPEL